MTSRLLQSIYVASLKETKAIRRYNMTLLMDSWGQTELQKMTGVPAAYLYQMSHGTGGNARGLSDDKARAIEAALTLEQGWMDVDRREKDPAIIAVDLKSAKIRRASSWPFKTVDRSRFEKLETGDQLKVEGAMVKAIVAIESAAKSGGSSGRR